MGNNLNSFIENTPDMITKIRGILALLKNDPENRAYQHMLHIYFHSIYINSPAISFGEMIDVINKAQDRISALLAKGEAMEYGFIDQLEDTLNDMEVKIKHLSELLKIADEAEMNLRKKLDST